MKTKMLGMKGGTYKLFMHPHHNVNHLMAKAHAYGSFELVTLPDQNYQKIGICQITFQYSPLTLTVQVI